jgi:hypothetical protein
MSLILPRINMELVLTRTYATVTHITVVISVSKTRVRVGKAMFVMLKSMVAMSAPMDVVIRAFHL